MSPSSTAVRSRELFARSRLDSSELSFFSDNNQKCVLCSDKNAIRFIPRENGVHSIDVKFNGCHIPGSPFNVRVGDPGLIGDPGMVTAHGAGLQGGTTGIAALP